MLPLTFDIETIIVALDAGWKRGGTKEEAADYTDYAD
jgi:hypothetical protein